MAFYIYYILCSEKFIYLVLFTLENLLLLRILINEELVFKINKIIIIIYLIFIDLFFKRFYYVLDICSRYVYIKTISLKIK